MPSSTPTHDPSRADVGLACFTDARVDNALGVFARRLLALGHWYQQAPRLKGSQIDGTFHMKRRAMARAIGATDRQLRAALDLLTEVGLHHYEGWRLKDVHPGRNVSPELMKLLKGRELRHVPVRRFELPPTRGGRFIASRKLVAWAKKQSGWGGYRHGERAEHKRRPKAVASNRVPTPQRRRSRTLQEALKRRPLFSPYLFRITGTYMGTIGRRAGSESRCPAIYDQGSNSLPSGVPLELPPSAARPRFEFQDGGSRIAGGHVQGFDVEARVRELGVRLLPPYPGLEVIPPVRRPAPRPLPDRIDPEDAARFLAASYRGAVAEKFPRAELSRFLRGRTRPKDHKHFKLLVDAAEHMRAQKIAPGAWALFSCDVKIAATQPRPQIPQVPWVYSLKRLQTRQEWFEDDRDEYAVERHEFGYYHLQLLADWNRMWSELRRIAPDTRPQVMEVVDRFFPGHAYEKRLRDALSEVKRRQIDVDRAVAAGEIA